ncbi:MAG TPA: gamma-glutamyl-gamma-aminobutyrate hydrolase family protein [Vicinamibacteria bacterium]
MKRPAIGISIGNDSRKKDFFALRDDYVRAVEKAGGLPLVLAPGEPEDAPELLDRLDGLVLTGGVDVDPALYGEEPHEKTVRVIPARDRFEIALCRESLARDTPLLAICRGHQVLNVATGGTLFQDIPSQLEGAADHDPDTERWEPAHDVRVLPGTRLREILGCDHLAVNSFHHQAVNRLGEGLVVSAYAAEDDVIEGIEIPGRRLAIGVQWHPEAFWDHQPNFQALFERLAAEAAVPAARAPAR